MLFSTAFRECILIQFSMKFVIKDPIDSIGWGNVLASSRLQTIALTNESSVLQRHISLGHNN